MAWAFIFSILNANAIPGDDLSHQTELEQARSLLIHFENELTPFYFQSSEIQRNQHFHEAYSGRILEILIGISRSASATHLPILIGQAHEDAEIWILPTSTNLLFQNGFYLSQDLSKGHPDWNLLRFEKRRDSLQLVQLMEADTLYELLPFIPLRKVTLGPRGEIQTVVRPRGTEVEFNLQLHLLGERFSLDLISGGYRVDLSGKQTLLTPSMYEALLEIKNQLHRTHRSLPRYFADHLDRLFQAILKELSHSPDPSIERFHHESRSRLAEVTRIWLYQIRLFKEIPSLSNNFKQILIRILEQLEINSEFLSVSMEDLQTIGKSLQTLFEVYPWHPIQTSYRLLIEDPKIRDLLKDSNLRPFERTKPLSDRRVLIELAQILFSELVDQFLSQRFSEPNQRHRIVEVQSIGPLLSEYSHIRLPRLLRETVYGLRSADPRAFESATLRFGRKIQPR